MTTPFAPLPVIASGRFTPFVHQVCIDRASPAQPGFAR